MAKKGKTVDKIAARKEELPKVGYTFFFDPSTFGNVDAEEALSFIEELKDMIDGADDTELYIADKSCELWDCVIKDGTCFSQVAWSIPQQGELAQYVWRSLKEANTSFSCPEEMDKIFTDRHNAFIGAAYSQETKTERYIVNYDEKSCFITGHAIELPKPDFWNERHILYPRLSFGDLDEEFIREHGEYYEGRFKAMNDYCEHEWKRGNFYLDHFKKNCDSSASDESKELLARKDLTKYRNFDVPGHGNVCCSYHLKHGSSVRTHLYPLDTEKKIHIAYAGPHLPTIKDPT